jgi:hypothetical protein
MPHEQLKYQGCMATLESPEKARALQELAERRVQNATITRVKNSDLPAGAPMYYYCRTCGEEMVLPETHGGRAPRYCDACTQLIAKGWLIT